MMSYKIFTSTLATMTSLPTEHAEKILMIAKKMTNAEREELLTELRVLETRQAEALKGQQEAMEHLSLVIAEAEQKLRQEKEKEDVEQENTERDDRMQSIEDQFKSL